METTNLAESQNVKFKFSRKRNVKVVFVYIYIFDKGRSIYTLDHKQNDYPHHIYYIAKKSGRPTFPGYLEVRRGTRATAFSHSHATV